MPVTSITFQDDQNQPRPARICPKCNRIGSVTTSHALKRFLSLVVYKSQTVWRCKKCGWNKPLSADWEPAVSYAIGAGRPSTSHETNPMYRIAEGWCRPPDSLFAGVPEEQPVRLADIHRQ